MGRRGMDDERRIRDFFFRRRTNLWDEDEAKIFHLEKCSFSSSIPFPLPRQCLHTSAFIPHSSSPYSPFFPLPTPWCQTGLLFSSFQPTDAFWASPPSPLHPEKRFLPSRQQHKTANNPGRNQTPPPLPSPPSFVDICMLRLPTHKKRQRRNSIFCCISSADGCCSRQMLPFFLPFSAFSHKRAWKNGGGEREEIKKLGWGPIPIYDDCLHTPPFPPLL